MRKGYKFLLGLLSCLCLETYAQQAPRFITDSLDTYINQGLKDWNVPGLAIAVIKDGKVVVMKGYGVKDLDTKEPVDENTLFMIASNTKLFTATAIAQLEYHKKLSIDDKVTKYIKDFSLYDKNATNLVTLRDLLSHRIGTKTFQGDFVFWNSNLSRQQIMYKMRLLKPTGVFRKSFGYCNSCVLTAGEVIPVVSRMPWEVYIYDSLLMPLQMNNTHTLGQGITQRANVAKPYATFFTPAPIRVPYDNVDNIGAAAGMVSNINDMTHWLQMQIDSGRYNSTRILPWSVLQRTREKNTIVRTSTPRESYGLGITIEDYRSREVYYHTGGASGFVSNTCFVPDAKLGIVILTNADNHYLYEALRYQILDAYLGASYINQSKKFLKDFLPVQQKQLKSVAAWRMRVKGTRPPLPLEQYTGTYTNELYGNIEVSRKAGGNHLLIDLKGTNNLKGALQYMDNDEWLLTSSNLTYGIFPVKLKADNNGSISVQIRTNEYIDYDTYTFVKSK
jgi:CubicO group peptidase (beta-lactamase class C family)